MEATLYYSLMCPHCTTFLRLLDRLPKVSGRVRRVQIGRNPPRSLKMVPAIVVGDSSPLYGEQAFDWLKRESSRDVKPFALGDPTSPNDGMQFTFLEDDAGTAGVDAPPASGLDALIARRNAEVSHPVARA